MASPVNYVGVIFQNSDFPLMVDREAGDLYFITGGSVTDPYGAGQSFSIGDEITWDAYKTRWDTIGSTVELVPGATGLPGETGVQGEQGIQGDSGYTGAQ
jgi:hypothetical protein